MFQQTAELWHSRVTHCSWLAKGQGRGSLGMTSGLGGKRLGKHRQMRVTQNSKNIVIKRAKWEEILEDSLFSPNAAGACC